MTATIETPKKTYTIAEFEALPEDDRRYELVNGELVDKDGDDMPGANEKHCKVASRLQIYLDGYVLQNQLGEVYGSDARYLTVSGRDIVRMPDVSFVQTSRIVRDVYTIPYAPDLAIEVISPGNTFTEIETKVEECTQAGAQLVWVIEPELQKTYVYRAGSNQREALTSDAELDGEAIIPGFKLKLNILFD